MQLACRFGFRYVASLCYESRKGKCESSLSWAPLRLLGSSVLSFSPYDCARDIFVKTNDFNEGLLHNP